MLMSLIPYLAAAANLILVLLVVIGLSQSVRRLRNKVGKCETAAQTEAAQLAATLSELKAKVEHLEENEAAQTASLAFGGRSGVDGALRTKVLKMHRLGQTAERIAGSLRVPKGDVDLLVKVHRIVMRPYQQISPPEAAEQAPEIL